MSDPVPDDKDDGDAALAAEFALGLLEGDALALATRRLLVDPDFAKEVEQWRHRFTPLYDEFPHESPPNHIWPRIEARLGSASPDGAIVKQLRRWRALALVSTALAASLGAFMLTGPAKQLAPDQRPLMVAQIAGENAGPIMLASYDAATHRFRVAPAALPAQGHSPELWLIPADGKPRSLGIFDPARPTEIALPDAITGLIGADSVIAVSIEPLGGSPSGQPTGPVVATGKMLVI